MSMGGAMKNLISNFFHQSSGVHLHDREEMVAISTAARDRLEQQGLLQVELDAQKEIRELVRAATDNREARAGDSEAA